MDNIETYRVSFHAGQRPIAKAVMHDTATRFVTAAAGRQGGKTYLVENLIPLEVAKEENHLKNPLKGVDVLYVAPSLRLAKDLVWDELTETCLKMGLCGHKGIKNKDSQIHTENGRRIILLGADNPNSLRGYTTSLVCVDEAKDIKRDAIVKSLLPTTLVPRGKIFMIGTPEGKGGVFYEFWKKGMDGVKGFKSFRFTSYDNPKADKEYLQIMKDEMPAHIFHQEYLASFAGAGGQYFHREQFNILEHEDFDRMIDGYSTYIAIDFAGFTEDKTGRRDDHAIAVVAVTPKGWFIVDILSGTWGARELSLHICRTYGKYRPIQIGGESGALKNAIKSPIEDYSQQLGLFFEIEELPHGGTNKEDRIVMELLGRAEHGRLFLRKAPWNEKLIEQAIDFPSKMSHDDLLDALAYVGRMAQTNYNPGSIILPEDEWCPIDPVAGF